MQLHSNPAIAGRFVAPPAPRPAVAVRLVAGWASSQGEVREAQALRHRVFAVEMGARLAPPPGTPAGHDADRFDDFCAHLLVRAGPAGAEHGPVVGTYRVLTPAAARHAGGFYSETEFDLARLRPIRKRMAELGRSCIDPAWRNGGGIILALWRALGEFMTLHDLDLAFGCASVGMADGGHGAASLWRRLSAQHLAPEERHVRPLHPLALDGLRSDLPVETPPLIKGYLRCGAELLGPPAWDADFDTADLPMLMSLGGLPQRHRRHFLGELAAAA